VTGTKNTIMIAVVAALAVTAAFYIMVLGPKRDEAAALQTQVDQARVALQAAQTDLVTYQNAKAGYTQSYAAVLRLGKAVPADDDVRSLMVQLDSAATKSRVDFRTIQVGGGAAAPATTASAKALSASLPPGAVVGAAGFPTMPFSFTFDGSFFRLSDFFSRLERFVTVQNKQIGVTGRLLTLDSIALEPAQGGFPNIKAQVAATSYLVAPDQGLTAGATAQGPTATGAVAAAGARNSSAAATAASTTATSTGAFR
jgi:hypothetical protein